MISFHTFYTFNTLTFTTAKLTLALAVLLTLNACQSTQSTKPTSQNSQPLFQSHQSLSSTSQLIHFAITGKIGVTTVKDGKREAGSAFYAWGQEGKRFAIDLTGVLGMGATKISYDGQTATLISDQGELYADSPEALLTRATGWQAPISQLPYWIAGRVAPDDTDSTTDSTGRLIKSHNQGWTANFEYKGNVPNHLTINHRDGHRVVMTIIHP